MFKSTNILNEKIKKSSVKLLTFKQTIQGIEEEEKEKGPYSQHFIFFEPISWSVSSLGSLFSLM
jgi:hypothetical protein